MTEDHTTPCCQFQRKYWQTESRNILKSVDRKILHFPFTYQTILQILSYRRHCLVMIFVSVILSLFSSYLVLQTSTSALDSVNDYRILYLLGNRGSKIALFFATDSSYFLVPLVIAGPLALLSTALLGSILRILLIFQHFWYHPSGSSGLLFVLYLLVTYKSKLASGKLVKYQSCLSCNSGIDHSNNILK